MDVNEVERDDGGDYGSTWTTISKPFAPHCRQLTTPAAAAHCLMLDMPDTVCLESHIQQCQSTDGIRILICWFIYASFKVVNIFNKWFLFIHSLQQDVDLNREIVGCKNCSSP